MNLTSSYSHRLNVYQTISTGEQERQLNWMFLLYVLSYVIVFSIFVATLHKVGPILCFSAVQTEVQWPANLMNKPNNLPDDRYLTFGFRAAKIQIIFKTPTKKCISDCALH